MFEEYTSKLLDNLHHAVKYYGINDDKTIDLINRYKYNPHFMRFAQIYLALYHTPKLNNLMYWRASLSQIRSLYKENIKHPSFLSVMADNKFPQWSYSSLGVACELYIFQDLSGNNIKKYVYLDDKICKYYRIYSHNNISYKFCLPTIVLDWLGIKEEEEKMFVGKTFKQSINILDTMILHE